MGETGKLQVGESPSRGNSKSGKLQVGGIPSRTNFKLREKLQVERNRKLGKLQVERETPTPRRKSVNPHWGCGNHWRCGNPRQGCGNHWRCVNPHWQVCKSTLVSVEIHIGNVDIHTRDVEIHDG